MTTFRNDNPHRLTTAPVVVGVDGSEAANLAVRWAAELAAQRRRELLVVHGLNLDAARAIIGNYELTMPTLIEDLHHRGAEAVLTARRIAQEVDPGLRVSTEVSVESPTRLLIDFAETANMVVLGESGVRIGRPHLGSTLSAVARHAHGPVAIVRDTGTEQQVRRRGPVVVGIDGSPISEAAIAVAFDEASQRNTGLIAVHVWSDLYVGWYAGRRSAVLVSDEVEADEQAILAERLAGWQEKYPDVQVTRRVYLAGPADHLLELSHSAQLVVVGSRGRGGFSEPLLGSTVNSLVQHSYCPVMVVHPDH